MRGKRGLFLARALCSLCAVCAPLFWAGCDFSGAKIVTIWTDQSVAALYAGYFNAAQDTYKAEVFYFDNAGERLRETKPEGKDGPDIVIGKWLTSAGTITLFRPIMPFYQRDAAASAALETLFYPGLLEHGRVKTDQVLLPVSFDAHVIAFARNNAALLPDPFCISLAELQEAGAAYNLMQNGAWTRVGFSPLWNEDFLFTSTALLGAGWREADPVAWDDKQLQTALEMLREWVIIANDSVASDDDFSFKYFYESPDKLAADGRILCAFMRASDFCKLAEERRAALDFRWLEHEGRIVPAENVVYYGVYRNTGSMKPPSGGAAAFTSWFFSGDTQNEILAKGKAAQNTETFFGIAGGLSAMRGVTEIFFPQYYTGMLGHTPSGEKIAPPGILPPFFPELKARAIIPAIREYVRSNTSNAGALVSRLSDWVRSEQW